MTIIYTLSENKIPFYVGKTVNFKKRWYHHKITYPNSIMEEVDVVDDDKWRFWERYYISLFHTWGFDLKNIRKYDGVGGHLVSIETRQKISTKLKGRISPRKGVILSDEIKAKISLGANKDSRNWMKGRVLSEETKLKMSLAKLGKSKPHMKLPRKHI